MRSRCAGGCCWRSKPPSAKPIAAQQRRLLTFVIVGGGPTGVELAGALAEIARQSLRQDFRRIRPESARIVLLEGGPHVLSTFPDTLRERGARVARAARRRSAHGIDRRRRSTMTACVEAGRCAEGRAGAAHCSADGAVGGRRRGVAARASLGVPLDRAGRVSAEPTLAVPGHREIFVVGDSASLEQDGQPLPGVAQVAMQEGAHAAKNVLRAIRGEPLEPFRYRELRQYGDDRPRLGGRRLCRLQASGSLAGCSGSSCTSSG